MRVLFLTRFDRQGASSRCRVYQYLPYLSGSGIEAEILPCVPSARELRERAGAADVVFLQKRLPTLATLMLLRRSTPGLVFDFDDAIWLNRRRDHTICNATPRTRLRLAVTLHLSDHVICGNEYLAGYARHWNGSVTVLPTPVDAGYYCSEAVAGSSPFAWSTGGGGTSDLLRLGWVGDPSNLRYLRRLEPVLAKLARRCPMLRLLVVSSEPYESTALPVENITWSLAEEVSNLRRLDIGLMPLDDDPWTRGKCGYKALQYMAVGAPVVCSPVGMNLKIVTEGKTGLLARDPAAWELQLTRLVNSAALRERLGAAGQEAALRDYSLAVMAPRLAEVLRSANRRRTRSTATASPHPSR